VDEHGGDAPGYFESMYQRFGLCLSLLSRQNLVYACAEGALEEWEEAFPQG